jgi:tetratricopeptide (TPR) repeat protein
MVRPALIDPYDIWRACRTEDAGMLAELARWNPASVVYHLDVAMRGSREGRRVPWSLVEETRTLVELEHERWLCEQDAVLRERAREAARAADLRTLRSAYAAGELFLVLGAGVSMAAGMPGWRSLVHAVLGKALRHRDDVIEAARANRIVAVGDSVFVAPGDDNGGDGWERLLPPLTPEMREAIEQTRAALERTEDYSDELLVRATSLAHDALGVEFDKAVRAVLYAKPEYRTEIHPALARLVRPPAPGGQPAPRVSMIVTYNFDSLVDRAISEAGYGFRLHVSRRGEMNSGEFTGPKKPVAVDIWHAHGYLPSAMTRDFGEGPGLINATGMDLVFSAHQYELQYGADSSFTRALHEWAFVNRPALIIGSSLSDSFAVGEFRTAHKRRPGWCHYCVMKRPAGERQVLDDEARFRAMGLRVLWVDDHDEIPRLLDGIREPLPMDPFDEAEAAHLRGDDQAEEQALNQTRRLPRSAFNLGLLYRGRGDHARAIGQLRRAIASRHDQWAPEAALVLGSLLEGIGDDNGAEAAYCEVLSPPVSRFATRTATALGLLRKRRGDEEGAKRALREAVAIGDPEWAPEAASRLARLLWELGDRLGAEAACQEGVRLGDESSAGEAAWTLGQLLAAAGETARAMAAYRDALRFGRSRWTATAAYALGQHLLEGGAEDQREGVKLLRDAVAMADEHSANDIADKAAHDLGAHLSTRDAFNEAEPLL